MNEAEKHLKNILKILQTDNYDEVTCQLIRDYCVLENLITSNFAVDIWNRWKLEELLGIDYHE